MTNCRYYFILKNLQYELNSDKIYTQWVKKEVFNMILDKLREQIKNNEYEAILLTGLENPVAAKNLKYVTGYTGSFGFAIIFS